MSRRRTIAAGGVVSLVVAGVALAATTGGFGGSADAAGEATTGATATATVARQTITAQTQASATLGFAGASTVVAPAGTAPSQVLGARQAAATAQAGLVAARTLLAADARALAAASARLSADRQKRAVDCAGGNAAQAASGGASGASPGACAADQQAIAGDEQNATAAAAKVTGDRQSVAAGVQGLAGANAALATAESSAAAFGEGAVFTRLPSAGDVIARGHELYRVTDEPVVLLYGSITAWRAFARGMSPGRDVAELNANLRALGFGRALRGTTFSSATEAAVRAFQSAHGLAPTGRLLVGSVVFQPAAVRVTSVTPAVGAAVAPGPVLAVTSRVRQVAIELDAGQQAGVEVGDAVTITLPDGRTTPGVVSSVGAVATSAQNGQGAPATPTIEVDVRPSDPAATGHLDQAPVTVSITTSTAEHALVVPVAALLALAGGGYAVEEVTASGAHVLVPVALGLFDDADGLVQVTGTTLAAGRRVVVPSV